MSGLRDAVKLQGQIVVVMGLIVFILALWLGEEYLKWRKNYTELHRRVSILEGYHK